MASNSGNIDLMDTLIEKQVNEVLAGTLTGVDDLLTLCRAQRELVELDYQYSCVRIRNRSE